MIELTILAAEIKALREMTVSELRDRYREVFGEESRSNHKDWLWKRVAWRIQELAEGGLSERAVQRAKELANEADVRVRPPRDAFSDSEAEGADVAQTSRATVRRVRDRRLPIPGTVLTRKYNGQQIAVRVLARGFEYDSQRYRSLSAIAREVTGSHWNGYLFFGLTGNGK